MYDSSSREVIDKYMPDARTALDRDRFDSGEVAMVKVREELGSVIKRALARRRK